LPFSTHRTTECGWAASVFMVLELDSNAMNRFTFTSEREVLQKVDFST